jgi:hypothetical protein
MTIQPYQAATEEMKRQSQFPVKLLKKAAGITGLALGGAPILARIAPLLSKFIPEDIAIKGLTKLDPRMGKFINSAMKLGHSFDEVKDFIGEKIQPKSAQQEEEFNPSEQKRRDMLQKANQRNMQANPLGRDALQQQFEQSQPQQPQQQSQGKAALLATMQEITESLRRMRNG